MFTGFSAVPIKMENAQHRPFPTHTLFHTTCSLLSKCYIVNM